MAENKTSIPRFEEFVPFGWQTKVLTDMEDPAVFDWTKGTQIIVFSGVVGSAKSLLSAHILWKHQLKFVNQGAFTCIARKDARRLTTTAIKTYLGHRPKNANFNKIFKFNKSSLIGSLGNRELILGMYYGEDDFERFKSLEFSGCWLEEATENVTDAVFDFLDQRTGRLKSVPERFIILGTNPDEPEHWINVKLISKAGYIDGVRQPERDGINYNIKVYYSSTDNPHLPKEYYENLRATKSAKWLERFLEGKWISFYGNNIYYAYGVHNHKRENYKVDTAYPLRIAFDFNTTLGKPMSCVFAQYKEGKIHFFDQIAIQGNTSQLMEEVLNKTDYTGKKYIDYNCEIIIHGDASGWSKQSAAFNFADYDIIKKALGNYTGRQIKYSVKVPLKNPEVKQRHEAMNASFKAGDGSVRIYLYENCFKGDINLDMAFRLTKLKEGAKYVEDDGVAFPYQHMGTAAGYLVYEVIKKQGSITSLSVG